ncbi:uncharacterized protein CELE_F47G4.14 [Caenorhabditis elegans]|uniref:Uncharacterized protein n=1 Tax=Caenorhabditis elegans TaxID=6239 RepID=A0A2K5ATN0_CAEEL|nr:Uncharacterized protein CELE_F47G4.14 [Caenorhabditis elegans]SPC47129.1 Uncharacterized protein CELE_F47G4.14 [Caenorhabditis elegans]|eukprot:NP_001348677.1 Uncharacterized protein CELE_F47G4.14 [Caenorhabditis elegans]
MGPDRKTRILVLYRRPP